MCMKSLFWFLLHNDSELHVFKNLVIWRVCDLEVQLEAAAIAKSTRFGINFALRLVLVCYVSTRRFLRAFGCLLVG